jgi:hypothetical protein
MARASTADEAMGRKCPKFLSLDEIIVADSELSRSGWKKYPKETQIRLVGYQRGNELGSKYGEKALEEGFVGVYKERGLGFPVLAYGDYIRYRPRASTVSPLGEYEQTRLWKESNCFWSIQCRSYGALSRGIFPVSKSKIAIFVCV